MKRCLVVDDSQVTRTLARRILEGLGLECVEAADGRQALDVCGDDMPDAVLLDWRTPAMSGLAFLERLRAQTGGKTPIVVFCTAENDLDHITRALLAGADEYIMKPFDSDIVASKLAEVGLV